MTSSSSLAVGGVKEDDVDIQLYKVDGRIQRNRDNKL